MGICVGFSRFCAQFGNNNSLVNTVHALLLFVETVRIFPPSDSRRVWWVSGITLRTDVVGAVVLPQLLLHFFILPKKNPEPQHVRFGSSLITVSCLCEVVNLIPIVQNARKNVNLTFC